MGNFWEHHIIGPVSTNCYVFGKTDEAIMIDPGGPQAVNIVNNLENKGIEVKHVLVSHGHFDHLGWAPEIQRTTEGAKVYLHEDERPIYEKFFSWMPRFGLEKIEPREPDVWLSDNQVLDLGGYKFQIIHTPGHSPGSASFLTLDIPEIEINEKIPLQNNLSAFVGDTIFEGSVGRVDFPFCDKGKMKKSIERLMNELNPATQLYPGHGNETNLQRELDHNPYLKAIRNNILIF